MKWFEAQIVYPQQYDGFPEATPAAQGHYRLGCRVIACHSIGDHLDAHGVSVIVYPVIDSIILDLDIRFSYIHW